MNELVIHFENDVRRLESRILCRTALDLDQSLDEHPPVFDVEMGSDALEGASILLSDSFVLIRVKESGIAVAQCA